MRIGVIVGGPSPERDGSYLSGEAAQKALTSLGHTADLVDMSDGFWRSISQYDVAFIAGHGWYAEDGKLQGLLEILGVPYTGSGVLASAVGMHKPTFKMLMRAHKIPTAPWAVLRPGSSAAEIATVIEELGLPLFVKPSSSGESLAAGIARSSDDVAQLIGAVEEFAPQEYIVEPLLQGNTVTVGILEIDGRLEALPALEAIAHNEFYDSQAKSDPHFRTYRCPAPLAPEVADTIQDLAVKVFIACECRGVARVDFMMGPDGPVVLEVNTVPGLTHQGNLAAMAQAFGLDYQRMIDVILSSATGRPAYCP
ncbi:D-alanine--D-alanine ligase [Streptomyces sp. NPDC059994]|uniref:D-alanine--D-alanine ligase family protein n=1 Tax=Streptomyces sp. NPDC059994 TaxID=3347029 RepID=UPI0036943796